MAKFCTECGKELEDGKACDCKASKTKKEEKTNSESFDFQAALLTVWETTKKMFKKPISTLKEFSKDDNVYVGLIIIAIVAILSGVSGLLTIDNIAGKYNGFEVFMKFFGISLIPVLVNVAVYFVVYNALLKSKVTWKTLVAAFSGTMILETIGSLVTVVCSYIAGWLATLVLVFTIAVYLVQFITIIKHVTNIDEEKNTFAFAACVTISCAISFLIIIAIAASMISSLYTTNVSSFDSLLNF
jgi:hypothetical protein